MRKDINGRAFLFPMPVLILAAYDDEGKPQCMNAAWGSVSGRNQISICVTPTHKTVEALRNRGEFTVSIGDAAHEVACDYVGVVSGNNEPDKFAKAGFTAIRSEKVNAPIIAELGMALECKVAGYDEDSHILLGDVVNISMDENVMDEEGNIDVRKLNPIIYDSANKNYYAYGPKVGKAYSDGHHLEELRDRNAAAADEARIVEVKAGDMILKGITVEIPGTGKNILQIKCRKGLLLCGLFSPEKIDSIDFPACIFSAPEFKDMLAGKPLFVSARAKAMGVTEDMTGLQIAEIFEAE